MQFNSVDFMIFFPVVLSIYFIITPKLRMYWLLASSYYFYMNWNVKYALLIGSSTVITYICGILFSIYKSGNVLLKKRVTLIVCILINLGILAVFKYANFAIDSVNTFLTIFQLKPIPCKLNLLLPVGISFYTFQALGYIIDVYRGETAVETNIFRYALFVSFFPQLVAGPIERSKNLLKQMHDIESFKLWNARRVTSGSILIIWGLFMKMVIADRISILVDTVYNEYQLYGGVELLLTAEF